ncbi:hypothetical protein CC79DRAFT_1358695 [Sarocladium strictum]
MESSTHRSRPPKRRAAVACLGCRKRKVRCDVARHGAPCSNCRFDEEECSVTSQRGHLRAVTESIYIGKTASVGVSPDRSEKQDVDTPTDILDDTKNDTVNNSVPPAPELSFEQDLQNLQELEALLYQHYDIDQNTPNPIPQWTLTPPSLPPSGAFATLPQTTQSSTVKDNHILYTYYPFLRHNDFSSLHARDFAILEAEGCFRVPHRQALDDFLHQYFVYVHPLLPLMDEADTWAMYDGESEVTGMVALLLIQSMLFAASHCVSSTTITSLGFSSAKKARAEYYRRAKLLHDIGSEVTPPHALAQASLLLSFWTPPGRQPTGVTPNTSWLVNAVQYAYAHHAHLYQRWKTPSKDSHDLRLWKRIWWCCIIRDRSLSLGLRRAPQITRHNFDFQNSEPLRWDDLYPRKNHGGDNKPRYFSQRGAKMLAGLLEDLMNLCRLLTDFQVFSQYFQSPVSMEDQSLTYLEELRAMKASLQGWRGDANEVFETDDTLPMVNDTLGPGSDADSEAPVFLHKCMVKMYYYSAVVALSHYELLLVLMAFPAEDDVYSILRFSYTPRVLQEVKDASNNFSQCLSQLVKPGLAKLLPISMTAFMVMPLLHHLVDVDLNSSSNLSSLAVGNQKQRERLASMVEVLRTLSANYDGVEWVNNLLKKSLEQNDLPVTSTSTGSPRPTSSTLDGTRFSEGREGSVPRKKTLDDSAIAYLRVAFTAEVSLSRSKLARGRDLPGCLATLFQQKKAPIGLEM